MSASDAINLPCPSALANANGHPNSSQWRIAISLLVGLSLATGCSSPAAKPADVSGSILVADENNYTTMASLTIPTIETVAAADLDICWDKVVKDLECHAVSAQTDLDNVALLRISHLTQAEVSQKLADGQLSQSSVAGYLDYHTDHSATCAKLSQLSFFTTAIDVPSQYVENPDYTYVLLVAKGTTPGVGARSLTFLHPTSTSTNTKVDAPTGCGLLNFSADLASLRHVPVPIEGPWVLDWSAITRDGQGNPVIFQKLDGLTMGFYQERTVADLQAQILDIELIATNLWDLPLTGARTADLSQAKDRATGASFAGFSRTNSGTWLFALTCSTCQNPAPLLLTILEPGAK